MIEALIKAEKECTNSRDIAPARKLRPIGTRFKEWIERDNSTDPPHWVNWEVVGHYESFVGRQGDTLLYERHEEIRSLIDK